MVLIFDSLNGRTSLLILLYFQKHKRYSMGNNTNLDKNMKSGAFSP